MCVIAIVKDHRPTEAQIRAMWDANSFGGGAAWRETDDNGETVVKWSKYLDEDSMVAMNDELPTPYILHFRIPSADTSTAPEACHPFVVNRKAKFDLDGATKGYVLFHNGYWTGWKHKIEDLAIKNVLAKLPTGPWSDTRALAWYAHHMGQGILEFIDEKVVTFSPNNIELFGSWQKIKNPADEKQGFFVSNVGWVKTRTTTPLLMPGVTPPANQQGAQGGAPAKETFRTPGIAENPTGGGLSTSSNPKGAEGQADQQKSHEAAAQSDPQGGTEDRKAQLIDPSRDTINHWYPRRKACDGCYKSTSAGVHMASGRFFCYQCWAEDEEYATKTSPKACSICKVTSTVLVRVDTGRPICQACKDTNGNPETIYRGLLEGVRES